MEDDGYYDDGYYDDDYDTYDACDAPAAAEDPEALLATTYAEGKSCMADDPPRCVELLTRVLAEDATVCGRWSFKAHRMLLRAACRRRDYEAALLHYERVAAFEHEAVPAAALRRAMRKATAEAAGAPEEVLQRMRGVTLRAASRDPRAFGDVYYEAVIGRAAASLAAGRHAEPQTLEDLCAARDWCVAGDGGGGDGGAGDRAEQLLAAYAGMLAVYHRTGRHALADDTYHRAAQLRGAPGAAREHLLAVSAYGGLMLARQGEWAAALAALLAALRLADGHSAACGVATLPELVRTLSVAAVMSDADGAALAGLEVQRVAGADAGAAAMVELHRAYAAGDVAAAVGVLASGAAAGEDVDAHLPRCLLLTRVRCLVRYTRPFATVRLSRLEAVLRAGRAEVMRVCAHGITQRLLPGARLDLVEEVLRLHGVPPADTLERNAALHAWSGALATRLNC